MQRRYSRKLAAAIAAAVAAIGSAIAGVQPWNVAIGEAIAMIAMWVATEGLADAASARGGLTREAMARMDTIEADTAQAKREALAAHDVSKEAADITRRVLDDARRMEKLQSGDEP